MQKIWKSWSTLFSLLLFFVMLLSPIRRAFGAEVTAVSVTASVENPKWFNGNWFLNASTPDDYKSINAQKKAYSTAKASGDRQGMFENAFWTSVQAWALNNEGHRALQSITEAISSADTQAKAAAAKRSLTAADEILNSAPGLDSDIPSSSVAHETSERAKAAAMISKNLLYARQLLGEVPWPKSSNPEADAE